MVKLFQRAMQNAITRLLVMGILAVVMFFASEYAKAQTVISTWWTTTAAATGACAAGNQATSGPGANCNASAVSAFWASLGYSTGRYMYHCQGTEGVNGSYSSGCGTTQAYAAQYGINLYQFFYSPVCPSGMVEDVVTKQCVVPPPEEEQPFNCAVGYYNLDNGSTSASCRPFPEAPPPGCNSPLGYIVGTKACFDDVYECAAAGGQYGHVDGIAVCFPEGDDPDVPNCGPGSFAVKTGTAWSCKEVSDSDDDEDENDDDLDDDGVRNEYDSDMDGDGTPNGADNDMDGDGKSNGSDNDMDGDGKSNGNDSDVDGDGIRNPTDNDNDQDGLNDNVDPQPNGPGTSAPDSDDDGTPDHQDDDDDNDGEDDDTDADDDGDGEPDKDTDGDGVPDSQDEDDDGDGVSDEDEAKSECLPEHANYFECGGLLEEAADDLNEDIEQQGNADALEQLDGFGETFEESLGDGTDGPGGEFSEDGESLGETIATASGMDVSCSDVEFPLSLPWSNAPLTISCTKFQPVRSIFGFYLSIMTMWSIFAIAMRPGPN